LQGKLRQTVHSCLAVVVLLGSCLPAAGEEVMIRHHMHTSTGIRLRPGGPWTDSGSNGQSYATQLIMDLFKRAEELLHAQLCANRFVLRERVTKPVHTAKWSSLLGPCETKRQHQELSTMPSIGLQKGFVHIRHAAGHGGLSAKHV
jgi:hypothetical protein